MGYLLQLKNVVKEYTTQDKGVLRAVAGVNMKIDKGDIYGIMGLSGAGKSTLIRLINRLEEPTSGEILLRVAPADANGKAEYKNILALNDSELRAFRQKTGMIFQHFNLLNSRDVYGNVAFALEVAGWQKADIQARVKKLLHIVGLGDKARSYPRQLSGGQKQRVAIARALANNPQILLSDEATSALDPRTTASILDLLKNINAELGVTIILITHQMEVIRKICNKTAILSQGKMIEEGTTRDIFTNPQTELAREFVAHIAPDTFAFTPPSTPSTRRFAITYNDAQVQQPYISLLIKKFDVEVNLISAKIDQLSTSKVGYMLIEMKGAEADMERAVRWLKAQGIKIDFFSD